MQPDATAARFSTIPLIVIFVLSTCIFLLRTPASLAPDVISYLSIGKDYAAGRWGEAVNGYWGPLVSWLLAPLLALGMPDTAALKGVAFVGGLAALAGAIALSQRFAMSRPARTIALAIAGLMVMSMMPSTITDLLLASVLLFYLAVLLGPRYANSIRPAIGSGVLGAVAYTTKSYAFFFFVAHFTLANILFWLGSHGPARKQVVKNSIAGLAAFTILSAPWVAAISWKEGGPVLGTSGAYNYRLAGPQSLGYPPMHGLLPPSRPHSISAWEDPRADLLPPWSPLECANTFRHELLLVKKNAARIALYLMHVSPLLILILPAYILYSIKPAGRWYGEWVVPAMTFFLYPAGYLLVTVEDRYFYIMAFLLLFMAFRAYAGIVVNRPLSRAFRLGLGSVLVASFCITPVRTLAALPRRDAVAEAAEQLAAGNALHGKLASCGSWDRSLEIANRLGLPYYGVVGPGAQGRKLARLLNPEAEKLAWPPETPERADQQLREHHIDYLLLWSDCAVPPGSLRLENEITAVNALGLRIYRLDHP
jgi:hypothetical protein